MYICFKAQLIFIIANQIAKRWQKNGNVPNFIWHLNVHDSLINLFLEHFWTLFILPYWEPIYKWIFVSRNLYDKKLNNILYDTFIRMISLNTMFTQNSPTSQSLLKASFFQVLQSWNNLLWVELTSILTKIFLLSKLLFCCNFHINTIFLITSWDVIMRIINWVD